MSLRAWVARCLLLGVASTALVDAELGGRLVGGPVLTVGTVLGGYLVGAWLAPTFATLASLAAVAMLTAANQQADPGRYTAANDFFFFAVLVGGVALAGHLVSVRVAQVRELRSLSAIHAEQRAKEVEAARLEERTRVDAGVTRVMMQRMSALVVQAAGIRREGSSPRDRDAVARVETGGRATLEELREVLGSLGAPTAPAREPQLTPERAEPGLGWVDLVVGCCGIPVAVECVATASTQGPALANLAVGVALGVPLAWRRTRPLVSSTAFLALAVVMSALLTPLTGTVTILLPLSLAAYALGAHTRSYQRGAGLLLLLIGGWLVSLADPTTTGGTGDGLVPSLVWLGLAFGAGVLAAQHADRAVRLADLLIRVEAGREDELRLAVAEQRQAIARDLHDTVAHAMTVVCLHAEAAQQRWSDDGAVEESLTIIESAAREAMGHLRAGLGVLETESEVAGAFTDEVHSFAGSLGVPVTTSAPVELSPSEHTLVRRVVRESLVNASRHAPGAPVDVRIVRETDHLVVEVTNAASGGSAYVDGSQRGLAGLREIFSAHGGTLEHGPTSEGGYAVTAYLPAYLPGHRPRVPA